MTSDDNTPTVRVEERGPYINRYVPLRVGGVMVVTEVDEKCIMRASRHDYESEDVGLGTILAAAGKFLGLGDDDD